MSATAATAAPSPQRALRRLFLTIFLRGHSARGLRREGAPRSVGQKLALTLTFYALFGLFALFFHGQPVFALAVYLHGMTFVFLGMFIASSAGGILFNKEEGDILLHRPVSARALLWAKIRVLIEVSLWVAAAFNLAGFFTGLAAPDGGWLFLPVHAVSAVLEALFCAGCIVLVYQLCLRWFGRERLEGLMTTAQVLVSIAAVLAGQIVPRVMFRLNGPVNLSAKTWWVSLLPPAWFAGFDDALAGGGAPASWVLAGLGTAATALVAWLAFGKLAGDYETGLQAMGETVSKRRPRRAGRRWMDRLVGAPPLRWWLRDPVARASFLLSSAYMFRDRDVKLRLYPGLAPMLVIPFIFLVGGGRAAAGGGAFGVAFCGAYLGIVPMLALSMIKYSQQWAAADIFRAAPMRGPLPLCDGARRAVLVFLTAPVAAFFGLAAWLLQGRVGDLCLLLPGLVALPVYALIPSVGGKAVPLSEPPEEAKSATRGLSMMGVMMVSMALSGLALWAQYGGWFWWFLLAETIVAAGVYKAMRVSLASARWEPME